MRRRAVVFGNNQAILLGTPLDLGGQPLGRAERGFRAKDANGAVRLPEELLQCAAGVENLQLFLKRS